MSAKLVEVVRLNGGGAGCHDRVYSHRPVGGEVFLLTSPFIEPTSGELKIRLVNPAAFSGERQKKPVCCQE